MLKYLYCKEVFTEVPEEISLALSISNCKIQCSGCNQPELWMNIGTPLTSSELGKLINGHKGITCVLFMGSGDNRYEDLNNLASIVKSVGLKTAVYLGEDIIPDKLDRAVFDYIKIGHWDSSRGGLNSPTTNQIMYSIGLQEDGTYREEVINHKFLKTNED